MKADPCADAWRKADGQDARLLEDQADLPAPDLAHLLAFRIELGQVDLGAVLLHQDGAADDPAGTLDDAENRPGRDALAAAALAHDAERRPRQEVESGAVHGLDRAFVREEVGFQVAHRQDRRRGIFGGHVGSQCP